MARPYLPPRDADLLTWADNFQSLIDANPSLYGLVSADATAIDAVVSDYADAYATAIAPSTRTPSSIAAKNTAKANLLPTLRNYAQQIASNAGVSSENKIAVGVNPRTTVPTPIPAPSTSPIISIIAATPLQLTVRYADQNTPTNSRAKPFGAISLQLYASVSATVVTDPTLLAFRGNVTKQPVAVNFLTGDVGKQAYIAGRWVTRTGLTGPWSTIKSFTVAGN